MSIDEHLQCDADRTGHVAALKGDLWASRRAGAWLVVALGAPVQGQVTSRVSVATDGTQATDSCYNPSISADGRYVAFASYSGNLVVGDTNGTADIFVRDLVNGTTERVSVDSAGSKATAPAARISADGRYVPRQQLDEPRQRGHEPAYDVFVHDRLTGSDRARQRHLVGAQANGGDHPSISADGRYWHSGAVPTSSPGTRTRGGMSSTGPAAGTTEIVSPVWAGRTMGTGTVSTSISADGRFVAFEAPRPTSSWGHERILGCVRPRSAARCDQRVSVTGGAQGDQLIAHLRRRPVRAFGVSATTSSAGTRTILGRARRDRQSGTTDRVSVNSSGAQANGPSPSPRSRRRPLRGHRERGQQSRGVRHERRRGHLQLGLPERHDRARGRLHGRDQTTTPSTLDLRRRPLWRSEHLRQPRARRHERRVAVYVRDRDYSPFTSLCDAGAGGVVACSCSNARRPVGCDNSAGRAGDPVGRGHPPSVDGQPGLHTAARPMALSIAAGQRVALLGRGLRLGVGCAGGTLKCSTTRRVGREHHCSRLRRRRSGRSPRVRRPRAIRSRPARAAGTSCTTAIRTCSADVPRRAPSTRPKPDR